jgi:hypothetical protein
MNTDDLKNETPADAKPVLNEVAEYVWIVDRDWQGNFKPLRVLKVEADKINLKQHSTEEEASQTIRGIWIEPDH